MTSPTQPLEKPAAGAAGFSRGSTPILRRRRSLWQWLPAIVIVAMLVGIINTFVKSDIAWGDVPDYFTAGVMLSGLWGTIKLTLAVMALAIALGVALAVAKQSKNPVLILFSSAYIWLFRGVPALVQLLLWFNLALLVPTIDLGPLYSGSTNDLMTPFLAALLGLGLSEAAYMAEIVRSGILSVPEGQLEAARSVGMSRSLTMRRVILPQAIRIVIPPTGNQFIGMLKYTSLAFAVSYSDLLSSASRIYSANFAVMEVLFAATAWYLILCTVSQMIQTRIERHFDGPISKAARAQLKLDRSRMA